MASNVGDPQPPQRQQLFLAHPYFCIFSYMVEQKGCLRIKRVSVPVNPYKTVSFLNRHLRVWDRLGAWGYKWDKSLPTGEENFLHRTYLFGPRKTLPFSGGVSSDLLQGGVE